MDTAATTRPDGPRTGADTDATPASRSATLWAQPRRRTPDSAVAVNAAPCRPRCRRSGSSQASRHLGGRAREHRQRRADGDRVAQADGPLGRGDADALVALAAEELGALVRVVPQRAEDRTGCGEQAVLAGRGGQLAEARAEHEASLHVTRDEAVVLEGHRQPVGRRSGESGGADELGEGGRTGLEGAEHGSGLVENADS